MKSNPYKLSSYFSELLNGNNLFRWDVLIIEENLHEEDLESVGNEFSFFNYVHKLLDCYQEFEKKNYKKALSIMNNLKDSLIHDTENSFYASIQRALHHVIDISKVTLMLRCNEEDPILFNVLDSMTAYNDLNQTEEAGILAIRSACCSMYSYKGTQDALDFIDRAIRKDPSTPFWIFLKGVYLYKLRTILNPLDPPSLEEREIFTKINEEADNPLFMVYFADICRESANVSKNLKELNFWFIPEEFKNSSKDEAKMMYEKSKKFYEKAFEIRPKCPVIAFRCCSGLMKLPQQYQNIKLAKKILDSFTSNCSGFSNCVFAFYYLRFGQKPDLAKKHLKSAMDLNVFTAHINSIRLSYNEDRENFNIRNLGKLLDIFTEAPKRKIIFSQIISYYLFVKSDLKSVCDNLKKYLKEGGPKNSLENHRSLFVETEGTFPLIDVIADEVKYSTNNRNLKPELRQFLEEFMHSMNFYNICIWKGKPQNLKNQILNGKVPQTKSRCLQPKISRNQNQTDFKGKPSHGKGKYFRGNLATVPPKPLMEMSWKTKPNKPQSELHPKEKMETRAMGREITGQPAKSHFVGRESRNLDQKENLKVNSEKHRYHEKSDDENRPHRRLSSEPRNPDRKADRKHNSQKHRHYQESDDGSRSRRRSRESRSPDRKVHHKHGTRKARYYEESDSEDRSRRRHSGRDRHSKAKRRSSVSSNSSYFSEDRRRKKHSESRYRSPRRRSHEKRKSYDKYKKHGRDRRRSSVSSNSQSSEYMYTKRNRSPVPRNSSNRVERQSYRKSERDREKLTDKMENMSLDHH